MTLFGWLMLILGERKIPLSEVISQTNKVIIDGFPTSVCGWF
jgi:hypothetical protein